MLPFENLRASNDLLYEGYRAAFEEVLKNGQFILGPKVRLFEEQWALFHQMPHCVSVANGLDALILALRVMDWEKGSEIIVPSNTYIATILSILHNGYKPVLVEPDIATYNIDPAAIEAAITTKTKAILVVHLYGKSCDMAKIVSIATANRLSILEDCAQSHGARYRNQLTGTFGEASCFSFYPTKNLGALGDGGAILCKDPLLASRLSRYRNYGSEKKYVNEEAGVNSRLDELQAAFLLVKLKVLEAWNEQRRNLAAIYLEKLKKDFIKPVVSEDHYDIYHLFTIRHSERDRLRSYLFENGIGTEIHYPIPPHRQNALQSFFKDQEYPIAEEIHNTILSLPCSICHTKEEIEKAVAIINAF